MAMTTAQDFNANAVGQYPTPKLDRPQSPFESLHGATEHLAKVREMVRGLADRLVGAQPMDSAGSISPNTLAIFDGVDAASAQIREYSSGIMADIQRIERRL